MFKKVITLKDYFDQVDESQLADIKKIHKIIRTEAPDFKPYIQYYGNDPMIGYGKYHYKYASGRGGDFSRIGLSARKNYISVYLMAVVGGQYLLESRKSDFPKAKTGKSCLSFKKLEDIDQNKLKSIIKKTYKTPFVGEV